ncbi:MAG: ABC transporter permease, partial [Clostridia bacterium]|nr:ABC transporter permease [Clostridia bacterium]
MFKYIVKRLALAILILLGVSLIIYVLIRCMPVSFIEGKIAEMNQGGATIPEETIENMKKLYGLEDDSFMGILKGYVNWLSKLVRFDFGISFKYGQPVLDVIVDHMGVSFAVALIATVFEFMIAIPLGITAATHQYSIRDYLVTICVMIGISLPSFF